ncbi:hypothetical protein [Peribacillus acanthi]|uniref:hypothetical protein n=1 Tax=Peribacillus acanthi TaxID=2171554 RepID=UPI000D3E69B1|nr:hypothetical protein [Peribacillus acanthi]
MKSSLAVTVHELNKITTEIEDIQFSSTEAYNFELLFEKIERQLSELEKADYIHPSFLDNLSPLINQLPPNSDQRFDSEFRLRELTKRIDSKTQIPMTNIEQDILDLVNIDKDVMKIEQSMILNNHVDFINIGKKARLEIVQQLLSQNKFYENKTDLYNDIDKLIHEFQIKLEIISTSTNIEELMKEFESFNLEEFNQFDFENKEKILILFLKSDRRNIRTISNLKTIINTLNERLVINSANSTTIGIDKINANFIAD